METNPVESVADLVLVPQEEKNKINDISNTGKE
jgi:hypothetical protein